MLGTRSKKRPNVVDLWKRLKMMKNNFKAEKERFLPISSPLWKHKSDESQNKVARKQEEKRAIHDEQNMEKKSRRNNPKVDVLPSSPLTEAKTEGSQEKSFEKKEEKREIQEEQNLKAKNRRVNFKADEENLLPSSSSSLSETKTEEYPKDKSFEKKEDNKEMHAEQNAEDKNRRRMSIKTLQHLDGDFPKAMHEMEKGTTVVVFEKDEKNKKIIRKEAFLILQTNENRNILCCEEKDSGNKKRTKIEIDIAKITESMTGTKGDPFWDQLGDVEVDAHCVGAILASNQDLHLEFRTDEEMSLWLFGINKLILSTGKKVKMTSAGTNQPLKEITYEPDA